MPDYNQNVRPGQVWASTDKRDHDRLVYVISVGKYYAATAPSGGPNHAYARDIRLDRFYPTSTGYRLVHDNAHD